MNSFRFLRSTVRSRSISARNADADAARAVRGGRTAWVESVIRAGPFR